MTGTDRIKEKILEDARARAIAIQEQAEKEAGAIKAQASEEAGQKRTELLEKAEAEGIQLHKRMLAVAGLEGRKELLCAKQDMIDLAFDKAMERVCQLPDKGYQKLLEKMIVDAAGNDGGEILLSQRDASRMDSQFAANIDQGLAAAGKNGSVVLSDQPISTVGGFILRSGDTEVNCTFEILFSMLRRELESEVVSILFKDVEGE
ncbi:MAG: V-type ATP synthase subunit E [Clostridiaceae bacterium]|jgi:V/A-type H+-transporting ATPase subunit E|nr:V-type ATP synthase subunit E [Clostridiaceae bacterium]